MCRHPGPGASTSAVRVLLCLPSPPLPGGAATPRGAETGRRRRGDRPRPRPGGLPRPLGNPALRGGRGGRGGGEAERADTRAWNSRGAGGPPASATPPNWAGPSPRGQEEAGSPTGRGAQRASPPLRAARRGASKCCSPAALRVPARASQPPRHWCASHCLGCPLCARGVPSITAGVTRVWELIHGRCLERCLVNPQ